MFFAIASALFLILSFPKFSLWPLAWVAFVPIFCYVRRSNHFGWAFFYCWVFGFLFFFATWEWLRHVSYFGWIFLAALYAFYFGFFGILTYWFWRRSLFLLSVFVLPCAWVVLEWIRTEIPVWGFGWNLLAYSQSARFEIASFANLFGAYGVSALIILGNLSIFFVLQLVTTRKRTEIFTALFSVTFFALILGLHLNYQTAHKPFQETQSFIRTAVIQGNIPQEGKWDPQNRSAILDTYEKLSRFVGYDKKLDLIIWPEAAFPGYLNLDREHERVFQLEEELGIPILLGSPHLEPSTGGPEIAYNSAYLIDYRMSLQDRYDKVRLVSFGEYVPWRGFFGPLGIERFAYSLGVSDFIAGKEVKVFSLKSKTEHRFSVLICFEDTFPYLARQAVDKGAQFLIVITNDAWFSKSAAAYQHLQASIFRAIENSVPVIRSANTGVSAFIDSQGEVLDRVKDKHGHDTFIAGGLVRSISLGSPKTFYRERGYRFPLYCLIFVLASLILTLPVSVRSEHD